MFYLKIVSVININIYIYVIYCCLKYCIYFQYCFKNFKIDLFPINTLYIYILYTIYILYILYIICILYILNIVYFLSIPNIIYIKYIFIHFIYIYILIFEMYFLIFKILCILYSVICFSYIILYLASFLALPKAPSNRRVGRPKNMGPLKV